MNMRTVQYFVLSLSLFCFLGLSACETVKKGTTKTGEAVGKAVDTAGGVTEGGVEGYMGKENPSDNPYGR